VILSSGMGDGAQRVVDELRKFNALPGIKAVHIRKQWDTNLDFEYEVVDVDPTETRKVWYIDLGPDAIGDERAQDIVAKCKEELQTYNPISMLEDYFIPISNGKKFTRVETIRE